MNYKKMWYELKKQMLYPNGTDRGLRREDILKKMDQLEVNESSMEFQTSIKPDFEIIKPDKVLPEIRKELAKVTKDWNSSL